MVDLTFSCTIRFVSFAIKMSSFVSIKPRCFSKVEDHETSYIFAKKFNSDLLQED